MQSYFLIVIGMPLIKSIYNDCQGRDGIGSDQDNPYLKLIGFA